MAQGRGHLRVPARGAGAVPHPSQHCPRGSQLCPLARTPVPWTGDRPWQRCVPAPCLSSCHRRLSHGSSARAGPAAGPAPSRTHHLAPNGPHVLLLCQPVLILLVGRVLQ